jgi:hypothetical protein
MPYLLRHFFRCYFQRNIPEDNINKLALKCAKRISPTNNLGSANLLGILPKGHGLGILRPKRIKGAS